jgi:hypothetical protein
VAAIKICQTEVYMLYDDPDTAFQAQHFQLFCDIVEDHLYATTQEWVINLNTGIETLAFRINGHTYPAHSLCMASGKEAAGDQGGFLLDCGECEGPVSRCGLGALK